MEESQIKLARHALGLPNKKNFSYRNYYCVGQGSPEYAEWEDMVNKGMAVKRIMGEEYCGDYFYLTFKGAKSALLPYEHISKEDAARMRGLQEE